MIKKSVCVCFFVCMCLLRMSQLCFVCRKRGLSDTERRRAASPPFSHSFLPFFFVGVFLTPPYITRPAFCSRCVDAALQTRRACRFGGAGVSATAAAANAPWQTWSPPRRALFPFLIPCTARLVDALALSHALCAVGNVGTRAVKLTKSSHFSSQAFSAHHARRHARVRRAGGRGDRAGKTHVAQCVSAGRGLGGADTVWRQSRGVREREGRVAPSQF